MQSTNARCCCLKNNNFALPQVCLPFLSGLCTFGALCRNEHPSGAECDLLIADFASRPCHFGGGCRTAGCLYRHPESGPGGGDEQGGEDGHIDGHDGEGCGGQGGPCGESYDGKAWGGGGPGGAQPFAAAAPALLGPRERLELFYAAVDPAQLHKVRHALTTERVQALLVTCTTSTRLVITKEMRTSVACCCTPLDCFTDYMVSTAALDPTLEHARLIAHLNSRVWHRTLALVLAAQVPAMLERFEGREEQLFESLECKYGQPLPLYRAETEAEAEAAMEKDLMAALEAEVAANSLEVSLHFLGTGTGAPQSEMRCAAALPHLIVATSI